MNSLKDKVVLITGATSGFGRACALQALEQGAKVVAVGRRQERLDALAEASSQLYPLCLDVRDAAAVARAVASLPEPWKSVDVLVNNAGLALGMEPFHRQLPEDNQQMIETNIHGLVAMTQAVLPLMLARHSGHIINISSIAGTYPYPGGNVYGATKAFVTQFSLNLRADLLGTPIRVTNIEPGMCDTEFSKVRFHGDETEAAKVYAGMQPLTAEDIARQILWCMTQPPHVNINRMEIMPVMQAFSPFAVKRESGV